MKIKKIAAAIAAISLICMTSCVESPKSLETDRQETETGSETYAVTDTEITAAKSDNESTVPETQALTAAPSDYPDSPVLYPDIEFSETGDLYEAEEAELNGGSLKVESENADDAESEEDIYNYDYYDEETEETTEETYKDFSGEGYVTGFKADRSTSVRFKVKVPSTQHYDFSFCISADKPVNCIIYADGREVSNFSAKQNGEFMLVTVYGIFLEKGEPEIEICPDGDMKLDYLRISNNVTLSEISYEAEGELSNPSAGESAKEVMNFLKENYGEYTLTGQYVSSPENKELELVYQITGEYPVIRFSALHNTGDSFDENIPELEACADWYENGGLVGLMWYWEAPGNKRSVYSKETDFRLSKAVTNEEIAELSQKEITQLYKDKRISKSCYKIILDIDSISAQLLSLKEKGVPVLWRPLHEGYGDWFWWGESGMEAYRWLWELMYTRMTEYHKLDNLIWVWNGQSAGTAVDKTMFDIASVDIYLDGEKNFGSRYEQFAALQKIVGTSKIIALSECSSVPDIDETFRDNSVWSFFGLWYGKYLDDGNGGYSEEFASREDFIKAYNSAGTITLDEYRAMKDKKQDNVQETSQEEITETSTSKSD